MGTELFAYQKAPELTTRRSGDYPVVVVGAGPVGLCAAIDLAQHGVDCVLLDEEAALSEGSRAICFSKRTLEILDRLGCAERARAKGVVWNLGKVYLRDRLLYSFDLLPESGHKHPAFINLQQYLLEQFLVERLLETGRVDARWRNRVVNVRPERDHVLFEVETPDGRYSTRAQYVIAADGARSSVRRMLGLEAQGQVFRDRFLIADVKMEADFPTERWFWFDPPFHREQSVLLHRQADNVWRIDFQLGWDADPELERKPERVGPRIQEMLGPDHPFTLEWVSVYTFQCRRMEKFRHGRVIFAGDAAHQVSPFGARGANGGIQDVDNLIWKLARVMSGSAPDGLLDTYDIERVPAADENILHSTRSTDFITPKSRVSRTFRDGTLQLAEHYPFARRLVNSGRLSTPHTYAATPLSTPDQRPFAGRVLAGAPAEDAPLASRSGRTWLLDHLGGRFVGVYFSGAEPAEPNLRSRIMALANLPERVEPLVICSAGHSAAWSAAGLDALDDVEALFAQRYDATPGTFYLIRPDQHVAARWRRLDIRAARDAVQRATGHFTPEPAAWHA
ncbi:MAG TPA: FAD-dependent oxidoreductase [Burkholderiales bacterium]|nr:FAD-dependent oxidoreductase [Burkholderiales bacterium]